MIKTCGNCVYMLDDGDGSKPYCALQDLYTDVEPTDPCCQWWQGEVKDQQLAASGAEVDFTQGLDARLLTDEKVKAIRACNYKILHFAWDDVNDDYTPKILAKYVDKWGLRQDKLKVYVLTNYNSSHAQDLYRIYKLREIGYDPFVMIYDKYNAPVETRHLQRWCNNKIIFNSEPDFANYKP